MAFDAKYSKKSFIRLCQDLREVQDEALDVINHNNVVCGFPAQILDSYVVYILLYVGVRIQEAW